MCDVVPKPDLQHVDHGVDDGCRENLPSETVLHPADDSSVSCNMQTKKETPVQLGIEQTC